MYKHYLKQIFQLFKENKLISCISIFGTALSICLIMVIVILYEMNMENMAPETNRDRMLYLNVVTVEGFEDGSRTKGGLSRYLIVEGINTLQLPEMTAAVYNAGERLMTISGKKYL